MEEWQRKETLLLLSDFYWQKRAVWWHCQSKQTLCSETLCSSCVFVQLGFASILRVHSFMWMCVNEFTCTHIHAPFSSKYTPMFVKKNQGLSVQQRRNVFIQFKRCKRLENDTNWFLIIHVKVRHFDLCILTRKALTWFTQFSANSCLSESQHTNDQTIRTRAY